MKELLESAIKLAEKDNRPDIACVLHTLQGSIAEGTTLNLAKICRDFAIERRGATMN